MQETGNSYTHHDLPAEVMSKLNLFREERKFCDFIIETDDLKFYAHRSQLAACSDYFKVMLATDSLESKQGKVTFREITASTMDIVLEFCYTSKIVLTTTNIQEVLYAASFLQIDSLISLAVAFIRARIDTDNCIGVMSVAERCNLVDLYELALNICLEKFSAVADNEEFLDLDCDTLSRILSHEQLDVHDDKVVFDSIIRWIAADVAHRKSKLKELLPCVRLVNLKSDILVDISRHQYVRESAECRQFVEIAKDYLLLKAQGLSLNGISPTFDELATLETRPRIPQREKQRIYALGGWTNEYKPTRTMEIYNPYTDKWEEGPPMTKKRCGVGAAIIEKSLYAVGGHDGTHYLDCIERFDIETGTWHQDVAPMLKGRTSVGVVALGGYLYTIGGQTTQEPVADVERYDPKRNIWERLAPMHEKRLGAGVAVLNGKIYVVGGFTNGFLGSVEIYYPESDCWKQAEILNPSKRKHLGCAALDDYIVAVGGRSETGELDVVEKFNEQGTDLSIMPSMEVARSGIGLVHLDDKLFAMGGCNGERRLNYVEVFDPESNKWSSCSPMLQERLGGGYAVFSDMKTTSLKHKCKTMC